LEGHPKFKSKKDNEHKFPVRYDHTYFTGWRVNIEKIGKIPYQSDTGLPEGKGACTVTNPRIKRTGEKWIMSFGMERDNQATGNRPDLTSKSLGIDLGIKTTATASFGGEKVEFPNINKSNVKKTKFLKQRIESKLSNIRKDYTHQTTHKLISLLPKRVVMEDLSVKNMMKNRHLAKAVSDQGWGEFIRQMEYKCEWCGIEFIQADRFYPSSKKCSSCGAVKKDLKLKDRVYKCNECGYEIDRDYNAALNLERYGLPEEKWQPA